MSQQRERARAASKFTMAAGLDYAGGKTAFHGYETLSLEGLGDRALPRRHAGGAS